jgi:hypothetical protein
MRLAQFIRAGGWGGGSRSAAQRPIGGGALLVVSETRLVVGKKDLGDKITSALALASRRNA